MDQITHLVEQHIRASESHLRHIDELMQRAATARAVPPEAADRLAQFQRDRARFGQELDMIRGQSTSDAQTVVKRSKGLIGALETMGSEIAKILMTFLVRNERHGSS